jgi:hypothetical protein
LSDEVTEKENKENSELRWNLVILKSLAQLKIASSSTVHHSDLRISTPFSEVVKEANRMLLPEFSQGTPDRVPCSLLRI